jgi:predicted molibdopterin-dependent oxidoreductase YjgC
MGCYSTSFPGGLAVDERNAAKLSEQWGFEVPSEPGMTTPEMLDAAGRGELDVLFAAGGNFTDVMPDSASTKRELEQIPLRVHMDIVPSSQMLVEPAEEVVLLPAMTRYEIPGGVTETSTERRVIFSPEIPGPRIDEARSEWEVMTELAARVRPEAAERVRFAGTAEIREEIGRLVADYKGIEKLREAGDSFQYGGPMLCAGPSFPTPDGKAHFNRVAIPDPRPEDGRFVLSTRRGKQFNSMVQESHDTLTAAAREAVLINEHDAKRLGLAQGDELLLRNDVGELRGHAHLAPIAPGNIQVHWPEGNALIAAGHLSPDAHMPDYNARVTVEPLPASAPPSPDR